MDGTGDTNGVSRISLRDLRQEGARERRSIVATLGSSLSRHGFVIVREHGILRETMARARAEAGWFFTCPLSTRMALHDAALEGRRGFKRSGPLRESFCIGREVRPAAYGNDEAYAKNLWPADAPAFRNALVALYNDFERISTGLLEALDSYLDEGAHGTFSAMARDGNSVLRANFYPPFDHATLAADAWRVNAHTDIGLLTVMLPSFIADGGEDDDLHVEMPKGHWLPVSVREGELAVCAGDMLAHVTHGRIPAATHRVALPFDSSRSRCTFPFYVHPRPDVPIAITADE